MREGEGSMTRESDTTNTYPFHNKDGGALLPTATGKLICARCQEVIEAPDRSALAHARSAHEAAGETPLVLYKRPGPEHLRVTDLSTSERATLCKVYGGADIDLIQERFVVSLVVAGLVTVTRFHNIGTFLRELTEHGKRLALACASAEAADNVKPLLMFDLGPPNPRG